MVLAASSAASAQRVLVFTAAAESREPAQPVAVDTLQRVSSERGFDVLVTDDSTVFESVSDYDAVVFALTSGDVVSDSAQSQLQQYIEDGGGFVGIASAAETELDWAWYGELIGARPSGRTGVVSATVQVLDPVHPASRTLPQGWGRHDRWLDFAENPRRRVHVLTTVDEASYEGGSMGHDHPIAWCQNIGEGRSFYTAAGYASDAYDDAFAEHLAGALEWAMGLSPGDCTATVDGGFAPRVLADGFTRPTQFDVTTDGRVFLAEIAGRVLRYDPVSAVAEPIGQLDVWTSNEGGLLGLALDPNFESTGWIYLYYSPSDADEHRLSRFDVSSDGLDGERILLRVPIDREQCCHHAGGIVFGPEGNLFIATGNNTNPFESDGFSESDEREGRAFWDAQRTSANTDDLRGKVLRIHPEPDGTYTLPTDNLFPPDGSRGRSEIFAMGVKNPFRISVDPLFGWVYVADVGPDAREPNPQRGPRGFDELNQLRGPANLGWPYCLADNRPYREFDFETRTSGDAHNCDAPVNNSPNNTGRMDLPGALGAWIYYPYDESTDFPAIDPGQYRAAMAGPVIRTTRDGATTQPPRYFDGMVVFWDWTRSHVYTVRVADDDSPLAIHRFVPEFDWEHPIDIKTAPDGTLYALSWGTFGDAPDGLGRLIRLDYVAGRPTPTVSIDASTTSGPLPLNVRFTSEATDPSGAELSYAWDVDGDGTTDADTASTEFTFDTAGAYVPRLTVTNPSGETASASVRIVAGNTAPVLEFETPLANAGYRDGQVVPFRVRVVDAEDGTSDDCTLCATVVVRSELGHGTHTHPIEMNEGCEGTTRIDVAHEGTDDLFWVLEASYTDQGAAGAPPLTTTVQRILLRLDHPDAGEPISEDATPRCDVGGGTGGGGCACRANSGESWLGALLLLFVVRIRR